MASRRRLLFTPAEAELLVHADDEDDSDKDPDFTPNESDRSSESEESSLEDGPGGTINDVVQPIPAVAATTTDPMTMSTTNSFLAPDERPDGTVNDVVQLIPAVAATTTDPMTMSTTNSFLAPDERPDGTVNDDSQSNHELRPGGTVNDVVQPIPAVAATTHPMTMSTTNSFLAPDERPDGTVNDDSQSNHELRPGGTVNDVVQPIPAVAATTDLITMSTTNSFLAPDERPDGTVNDVVQPIPAVASNHELSAEEVNQPHKKMTRKRVINQDDWKSCKRLKAAQHGEEYTTIRGKRRDARSVKNLKDCLKCKFKCARFFEMDERKFIHEQYWSESQVGKDNFIVRTSEMSKKIRGNQESRRNMSFAYFFITPERKMRVCKEFYLGTLDISQSVIYRVHLNKDSFTDCPMPPKKGKHTKRKTKDEVKAYVKAHIESFPVVESHYCRARTNKTYLESDLNIRKMFELYTEKVTKEKKGDCYLVKQSFYREIFNTEYNIAFFKPKSDRCDDCERYKISEKEGLMTPEMAIECDRHVKEKNAMRADRKMDRENKQKLVISFDLQNVITCPRANISSFFYHSKLNVYNLTAHASKNKKGYCAVWMETTSGRTGNDLASAMTAILKAVIADFPEVVELTTWSDSCVPQNRNSIMSMAILKFMSDNPQIETFTMKYSSPGHGAVQEVDNLHSQIEKAMKIAEFYSPLSFIRILLNVNRHNPYKVIQMRANHFFDFQGISSQLQFKKVPFTKVKVLQLKRDSTLIKFKQSFTDEMFEGVDIAVKASERRVRNDPCINYKPPDPKFLGQPRTLPQNKINSLKAMLKFMPLIDRQYYSSILNV